MDTTRLQREAGLDAQRSAAADGPESKSSPDGLRQRMDQLPPGHPSSPYEADGSRREPYPRSSDVDGAFSFTDAEWVDHVTEVREELEDAQAKGLSTDRQHTIDPEGLVWSAGQTEIHDRIIDDLYTKWASIPCEHKAIVAGGLPGAGKTTVLGRYAAIDSSQYMKINPDDIKEELAARGLIPEVNGLSPMEASDLVHEESSYLAKRLADRARVDGKNIIWDITMSSYTSAERRIDDLRSDGYNSVTGIFVDIPVELSARRADARHREDEESYRAGKGPGGRFVPAEVIGRQSDETWGSKNRRTFEELKQRFDHWTIYDNSVDGGQPALIDRSNPPEEPTHDERGH